MLECLAPRQRAEPVAVLRDEGTHPIGVGLRVLAKRPADGLAQEEVAIVEVGDHRPGQQPRVGRPFQADLADDRAAPQPAIIVVGPAGHHRRHLVRARAQQGADAMGHLVHVVPPRAGRDHLPVHGQQRRGLQATCCRHAGERRRGVALLAVLRLAPERERRVGEIPGCVRRPGLRHGADDDAHSRHGDAQVGHGRFHVRLHLRRAGRVGGCAQLVAYRLDERVIGGHVPQVIRLDEFAWQCIIAHMGYRVAVAGASGYAGGELLRLLAAHPDLDVVAATAHDKAGQRLGEVHPGLRSLAGLTLGTMSPDALTDADEYQRYYGTAYHPAWTYGLPELPGQRALIAAADRVANTGCYAVATILALAPLVAAALVEPDDVVVVAASGTSGAGRSAKVDLLGSEVMGDVSAYQVGAHRHVPEILQASGARTLSLTPLLAPMPRGILATVTARPVSPSLTADGVRTALAEAYAGERFVHVLPEGQQPHTAATAGSNSAHLQAAVDLSSGRIIVTSAIDNLGKGAAGQAVQ